MKHDAEIDDEMSGQQTLPDRLELVGIGYVCDPDARNRAVISKVYGYDSQDAEIIAEMVRRYNAHEEMLRRLRQQSTVWMQ